MKKILIDEDTEDARVYSDAIIQFPNESVTMILSPKKHRYFAGENQGRFTI